MINEDDLLKLCLLIQLRENLIDGTLDVVLIKRLFNESDCNIASVQHDAFVMY